MGFVPFTFIDFIDIVLVAAIMYWIYRNIIGRAVRIFRIHRICYRARLACNGNMIVDCLTGSRIS